MSSISYFSLRYVIMEDRDKTYINIVGDILVQINTVLMIINYSAIDAHHLSKPIKILCGLAFSGMLTLMAIQYSLFRNEYEQSIVFIGSIHFSVSSFYASALNSLSIFFWKQTILLMTKGKKCVNIRHSPRIRWVDHNIDDNNN